MSEQTYSEGLCRHFFLAYRDAFHESLGRAYCERSSQVAAQSPPSRIAEWKFEMLAVSAMRDLALAEAEQAGVFVVSTRAGEGMPAELKVLLSECGRAGQSVFRSLVVLLSSAQDRPGHLCADYSFLQSEAKRLRARLLVNFDGSRLDLAEAANGMFVPEVGTLSDVLEPVTDRI